MPYAPFHEKFPDIAEAETRTLTTTQDAELPVDSYGLIEMFCDEPDCDCRRVMLNVSSWSTGKTLAVIAYGWESKEFYADWFGGNNNKKAIKEMQGPILNTASRQSKFAPTLLELVTLYALQDQKYIRRVKRHYRMFRKAIDQEQSEGKHTKNSPGWFRKQYQKLREIGAQQEENASEPSTPKIGRNAPCPCGSGKKYKKCCGR